MQWYLKVLKNYFTFSGRARRKEYWMFVLINGIIGVVLAIVEPMIGTTMSLVEGYPGGMGIISTIYSLLVLIPTLAVTVRRLHDLGKSGGWIFISLVPCIGGIWLLVLTCTAGTVGPNQYGDDPKQLA